MSHLSKTLLTVAIAGLGGGSMIDYYYVKANPALTAVLPLGAIAFGLFLIVSMLEKEMAKYDEEQARKTPLAASNTAPAAARPAPVAPTRPRLVREKAL